MHTGFTITAGGTQATPLPYFFLERYADSYVHQWEAFRDYLQLGGPSPVPAQEARASIAVALAAKESFLTRQPVKVQL
jgi:myo-inositol 2-dehydrogenase/D-chiro-inositol 1-dehydrogenase